jgi:acyl-homoserine lactone acylase PvdQ
MRKTLRILTVVVVFLLLIAAGGFFHLRRSLPQVEGEITLAGLEAPVEILRDPHGVPHIFARSMSDASFALGFVHAQDRLWQMETSRRVASGRVAELAGPAGQSGNPLSRHYRDLSQLWARGEYVPMLTERKRVEALGARRLLLTPR